MDIDKLSALLEKHSYKYESQIGKGGFATCFKVLSMRYNEEFVCKLCSLPPEDDDQHKRTVAINSYNSEIDTLGELIHPYIIKIYEHFIEGPCLFLILEYCEGGSIDVVIKRQGKIPQQQLIPYVNQFVSGLAYCHSMNIAHRDIKPGNMLLDRFGRIKLADFGLAHLIEKKKLIDSYYGSLAFMAPEILEKRPYDPFKADAWAVGVTIYVMLTGVLPFTGRSVKEFRDAVNVGLYSLPNGAPPIIITIIKHLLVVDPTMRWSVAQVEDELKMARSQDEKISQQKSGPKHCLISSSISLLNFTADKSILRRSAMKLMHKNTSKSTFPSIPVIKK